jgi:hypothetical protein
MRKVVGRPAADHPTPCPLGEARPPTRPSRTSPAACNAGSPRRTTGTLWRISRSTRSRPAPEQNSVEDRYRWLRGLGASRPDQLQTMDRSFNQPWPRSADVSAGNWTPRLTGRPAFLIPIGWASRMRTPCDARANLDPDRVEGRWSARMTRTGAPVTLTAEPAAGHFLARTDIPDPAAGANEFLHEVDAQAEEAV